MVLIYFLPFKLQSKQQNIKCDRLAFSSFNFNLDLDKVEHIASEVGFDGSFRVGAIYEGRIVVLHPDNLPGGQLYADGSGAGWCGTLRVSTDEKVSLFIDQQPEVGTFIITSLATENLCRNTRGHSSQISAAGLATQ